MPDVAQELVPFAVYNRDYHSLTFYGDTKLPKEGSNYKNSIASRVFPVFTLHSNFAVPWYDIRNSIDLVKFDSSFNLCHVSSLAHFFARSFGQTQFDFSELDTSHITDMSYMFCGCRKLTSLDLSNFDTSNVTNMRFMFDNCSSLTNIDGISNWDTSNATDMTHMFWHCYKFLDNPINCSELDWHGEKIRISYAKPDLGGFGSIAITGIHDDGSRFNLTNFNEIVPRTDFDVPEEISEPFIVGVRRPEQPENSVLEWLINNNIVDRFEFYVNTDDGTYDFGYCDPARLRELNPNSYEAYAQSTQDVVSLSDTERLIANTQISRNPSLGNKLDLVSLDGEFANFRPLSDHLDISPYDIDTTIPSELEGLLYTSEMYLVSEDPREYEELLISNDHFDDDYFDTDIISAYNEQANSDNIESDYNEFPDSPQQHYIDWLNHSDVLENDIAGYRNVLEFYHDDLKETIDTASPQNNIVDQVVHDEVHPDVNADAVLNKLRDIDVRIVSTETSRFPGFNSFRVILTPENTNSISTGTSLDFTFDAPFGAPVDDTFILRQLFENTFFVNNTELINFNESDVNDWLLVDAGFTVDELNEILAFLINQPDTLQSLDFKNISDGFKARYFNYSAFGSYLAREGLIAIGDKCLIYTGLDGAWCHDLNEYDGDEILDLADGDFEALETAIIDDSPAYLDDIRDDDILWQQYLDNISLSASLAFGLDNKHADALRLSISLLPRNEVDPLCVANLALQIDDIRAVYYSAGLLNSSSDNLELAGKTFCNFLGGFSQLPQVFQSEFFDADSYLEHEELLKQRTNFLEEHVWRDTVLKTYLYTVAGVDSKGKDFTFSVEYKKQGREFVRSQITEDPAGLSQFYEGGYVDVSDNFRGINILEQEHNNHDWDNYDLGLKPKQINRVTLMNIHDHSTEPIEITMPANIDDFRDLIYEHFGHDITYDDIQVVSVNNDSLLEKFGFTHAVAVYSDSFNDYGGFDVDSVNLCSAALSLLNNDQLDALEAYVDALDYPVPPHHLARYAAGMYSRGDTTISEGVPSAVIAQIAAEQLGVTDYDAHETRHFFGRQSFCVYSEDDNSLTFYADEVVPNKGDKYNGKTITDIFVNFEHDDIQAADEVPLENVRNEIMSVSFDESFGNIKPTSTAYWCWDFENCKSIEGLENLDTSHVTDMSAMFGRCYNIKSLDVSHFDTSNVTDMGDMFCECESLKSLNISNFDTSQVTNMCEMFAGCKSLRWVDTSDWDTSSVVNMGDMFNSCSKLVNVEGIKYWDLCSVKSIDGMFENCSNLDTDFHTIIKNKLLPGYNLKVDVINKLFDTDLVSLNDIQLDIDEVRHNDDMWLQFREDPRKLEEYDDFFDLAFDALYDGDIQAFQENAAMLDECGKQPYSTEEFLSITSDLINAIEITNKLFAGETFWNNLTKSFINFDSKLDCLVLSESKVFSQITDPADMAKCILKIVVDPTWQNSSCDNNTHKLSVPNREILAQVLDQATNKTEGTIKINIPYPSSGVDFSNALLASGADFTCNGNEFSIDAATLDNDALTSHLISLQGAGVSPIPARNCESFKQVAARIDEQGLPVHGAINNFENEVTQAKTTAHEQQQTVSQSAPVNSV